MQILIKSTRRLLFIATPSRIKISMFFHNIHQLFRAMYHSCPICPEVKLCNQLFQFRNFFLILRVKSFNLYFYLRFLFYVLKDLTILPYEHTIYLDCVEEMEQCQHHSCHVWSMGLERLIDE